jgi:thymidylate kinase
VPEDISIERQRERGDPYTYTKEQLKIERKEYTDFAKKHKAIVINGKNNLNENILNIINKMETYK